MELQFLADIITAMHMFCFAVGIGVSLFIESVVVPRFLTQIDRRDVTFAEGGHRLIKFALLGLWTTGFALLFVKVGLMGAPLTAKLAMKFIVVAVLTFNMKMIADHALPVIRHNIGHHLGVLTRYELRMLGAIAGVSTSGWMLALGLGAIGMFKTLAGWQLAVIFLPLLIAAPLIGAHMAPKVVDEARLGPRLALR